MNLKNKTVMYYPKKTDAGFTLHRTLEPKHSLGFATFRTKKQAISAGKRWYSKYVFEECRICNIRR